MSYFEAVVIGLVQGVSELFPVSSLGHAVLIPAWIGGGWASTMNMTADKSPYLALIVALHVATAAALILFFRNDWIRIIKGLISSVQNRRIETPYERVAWLLIIGTVPVGIAGIILDKLLRQHLGKPAWAAVFLLLNGGAAVRRGAAARRQRPSAPGRGRGRRRGTARGPRQRPDDGDEQRRHPAQAEHRDAGAAART